MLPEDATDAGLLGVSFFGGRGLSMPFSGGEWVGLARGVAGSWRNTAIDFDLQLYLSTYQYGIYNYMLFCSPH